MIPTELQEHAEWCVWKREIRGGKPTKVPYNPNTGERAETNNPETFGSFDLADERYMTEPRSRRKKSAYIPRPQ